MPEEVEAVDAGSAPLSTGAAALSAGARWRVEREAKAKQEDEEMRQRYPVRSQISSCKPPPIVISLTCSAPVCTSCLQGFYKERERRNGPLPVN